MAGISVTLLHTSDGNRDLAGRIPNDCGLQDWRRVLSEHVYTDLMALLCLLYAPSMYMQSSLTCSSEPQSIGCGKSTAVDHWSVAVFNTSVVAILLIAGHRSLSSSHNT